MIFEALAKFHCLKISQPFIPLNDSNKPLFGQNDSNKPLYHFDHFTFVIPSEERNLSIYAQDRLREKSYTLRLLQKTSL